MTMLKTVAAMRCDFVSKFGIPRQSNLVEGVRGTIIFEPEFRNADALRGLESFSHIWLIWGFSEMVRGTWSPTVRPPRLGGNNRMGVFATRSPNRPNPLGLSSVRLDGVEQHPTLGPLIHVLGADLMDGTPIYDIKPYIPYSDSHPEAVGGFADEPPQQKLQVVSESNLLDQLPVELREVVRELLSLDPRPAYQRDPDRIYGMSYGEYEIRFSVEETILTVCEIEKRKK